MKLTRKPKRKGGTRKMQRGGIFESLIEYIKNLLKIYFPILFGENINNNDATAIATSVVHSNQSAEFLSAVDSGDIKNILPFLDEVREKYFEKKNKPNYNKLDQYQNESIKNYKMEKNYRRFQQKTMEQVTKEKFDEIYFKWKKNIRKKYCFTTKDNKKVILGVIHNITYIPPSTQLFGAKLPAEIVFSANLFDYDPTFVLSNNVELLPINKCDHTIDPVWDA